MPPEQARLEQYLALLHKWQKAINLVSPATLPEAWERHILDSAQLAALIPAGARTLFDLGSGAGFPGMVLAVLRPELAVHLIESDQRKCAFLQTVSRETGTPVTVHNSRIEALAAPPAVPDVVTARALAPLPALLAYAAPWAALNPDLTLLFLKGGQAEVEVTEAQEGYDFSLESFPSATGADGRILRLTGLTARACA